MRTYEEQLKDTQYQAELFWAKKNIFQAVWYIWILYSTSVPFARENTQWIPKPYSIQDFIKYFVVGFKYWAMVRNCYHRQVKIFKFYKGWGFDIRFYRSGYNDFDYPEIHITLIWGKFFITIPYWKYHTDHFDAPDYGIYFHVDAFVICYGIKKKFLYVPWAMEWVRTSMLTKENTWLHEQKGDRKKGIRLDFYDLKQAGIVLWSETYPYKYTLKNGTVQERQAKLFVEEREWRPRWLIWTPLFKSVRRSIDINFDEEVGERTGSWKGGVLGTGYVMLPGETPLQTLQRMQRERVFN